ncbi:DUF2950 family protein [Azospirillum isscasi]|uniref:DUF2950 family protein n=1 Tax=Azospirillum isscasi TaxID=3053926 RepID=A0ABU0WGA4_9PROT|nr:DUF2950 family protein [Azospirillum isscasi]MDQ2103233.1 DUF2950 family protein [Azospirillum isscasi]
MTRRADLFRAVSAGLLATVLTLGGVQAQTAPDRRSFTTPEAAAEALRTALAADDTAALLAIFGPESADIIEGPDPASARIIRRQAAKAAAESLTLHRHAAQGNEAPGSADSAELVLGHNHWPFPIPLRDTGQGWIFDTEAGADEIYARRIGADELDAIAALHAMVRAQQDYAARHRKPVYARYIQSTAGRSDGLWWDAETAKTAGPSPLSAFVEKQKAFLEGRQPGDPYRGYSFRMLTAQGPGAPGGEKSFSTEDHLEGGFAILAWPADYGQSGIMTFQAGPDGRIWQKDLGEDTDALVQTIWAFDPSDGWEPVKEP